jgi:hypothetical protein
MTCNKRRPIASQQNGTVHDVDCVCPFCKGGLTQSVERPAKVDCEMCHGTDCLLWNEQMGEWLCVHRRYSNQPVRLSRAQAEELGFTLYPETTEVLVFGVSKWERK